MPRSSNQSTKLRFLEQYFFEATDEDHGVGIKEIQEFLQRQDIEAERRTLYNDIETLRRFGLDILKEKDGSHTVYKLVSRRFESAELQLLADMVNASKFITEKKSKSLIEKLGCLTSSYGAKRLENEVMLSGKSKTNNESVFYNVDTLHRAIAEDRTVQFYYWNWNLQKQEELKYNGKLYEISPWLLCCDNEKYYLVGFDPEMGIIKNYRVDKMKNIEVTDNPRTGGESFENLDVNKYLMSLFGMFGGKPEPVELTCKNNKVGILLDRFGTDIEIRKADEENFTTSVNVSLSDQFYGWVMGLGGDVKVTKPEKAVEEMKALAEKFLN